MTRHEQLLDRALSVLANADIDPGLKIYIADALPIILKYITATNPLKDEKRFSSGKPRSFLAPEPTFPFCIDFFNNNYKDNSPSGYYRTILIHFLVKNDVAHVVTKNILGNTVSIALTETKENIDNFCKENIKVFENGAKPDDL